MTKAGVLVYDLSTSAGWALYAPGRPAPRHGVLKLPKPNSEGFNGAMFKLLFDHISWADRNFGLAQLGFESFMAPTGGRKDDDTPFVTNPKTLKVQIGLVAIVELCAAILEIPCTSIHNASWRRQWLGSQPRGTKRERWKQLAVDKATRCGWAPKGDDDADAIGQLHFLLTKLGIRPDWEAVLTKDLVAIALGRPDHKF